MDLPQFIQALNFATQKHQGQMRKDGERPYIQHPIEVATVLVDVGLVVDMDILQAAFLHDTVEDTDTTYEELEVQFGPIVMGYVQELTDDTSLPKAERKQKQIENTPLLSDGAKQIRIADKICNLHDVIHCPPNTWPLERQQQYWQWCNAVLEGAYGVNPLLDDAFKDISEKAKQHLFSEKG